MALARKSLADYSGSPKGNRVILTDTEFYTNPSTPVTLTNLNDSFTTSFTLPNGSNRLHNIGFNLKGSLEMGAGLDALVVRRGNAVTLPAVSGLIIDGLDGRGTLDRPVTLSMGSGNDSVDVVLSPAGHQDSTAISLKGYSKIELGDGNNSIKAISNEESSPTSPTSYSDAFINASTLGPTVPSIVGGINSDSILADGQQYGLDNRDNKIALYGGGDKISAYCKRNGVAAINIDTLGTIDVSGGTVIPDRNGGLSNKSDGDVISAISTGHPLTGLPPETYTPNTPAIKNNGKIIMGAGRDVLDAISGGFAGSGTYNLGYYQTVELDKDGNPVYKAAEGGDVGARPFDNEVDVVTGFGAGTFYGGGGQNSISLPEFHDNNGTPKYSRYNVVVNNVRDGVAGEKLYSGTIKLETGVNGETDPAVMTFTDFNAIGGVNAQFPLTTADGRVMEHIDFTTEKAFGVAVPNYSQTPVTLPVVV